EGSVSGLTGYKSDTSSCQVDLMANPGNSGSPVMNEKGELVGVLLSKNPKTDGETYVTRTEFVREFLAEMSKQKKNKSLKLNGRSPLKGQSISGQVKSVSPYIFIVRTK
ncbi:MAG: trypsin-like peptidase domain-containing protein, partial [Flavobacteriales bacterium]